MRRLKEDGKTKFWTLKVPADLDDRVNKLVDEIGMFKRLFIRRAVESAVQEMEARGKKDV